MTYSSPSTASFRPYTSHPSTTRHHPTPTRPQYAVYVPSDVEHAPVYQPRRRVLEEPYHLTSSSSAQSSASAASYSPLSLCSSVSSVSSSSSGSATSSDYSQHDSFDLQHDMEDDRHHQYYPAHPHKAMAAPRHKPHPSIVHPQEPYIPYPSSSPSYHPHPISVAIPPPSWKEPAHPRRQADYSSPPVIAATPLPDPSPFEGSIKKKKARSIRRCMDREKHSKAEQKRRGEMKALFDQLQDVSNCVYKDRIHILSLAIETIQGQQATIEELRAGKRRALKGEGEVKTASSSSASSQSSSQSPSPSSSPQLTGQRRKSEDLSVKQEGEQSPSKKSRPSPSSDEVHEVLDLSSDAAVAEAPVQPTAVYPSSMTTSASSVSLSTFGHGEFASYLMDHEEGHSVARLPCMSPAPSFAFQPQGEWWPTVEAARKEQ